MRVLKWLPAAVEDLIAIVDFISDDNINAAQQLKDEIERRRKSLLRTLISTALGEL